MLDDDQKQRDAAAQELLAKNFAAALAESGVSPGVIAQACNVTEQAVSNWKRTGKIRSQFLPVIADATRWSLRRLLTGLDDGPSGAAPTVSADRIDPAMRQAIDDLTDLRLLDPEATEKLLSDLHNAADRARAIARRAAAHAPAQQTTSAAARRGKHARSELTLRIGDGNPNQGTLPLVPSADPFNEQPSEREADLYARIARDRERHPR